MHGTPLEALAKGREQGLEQQDAAGTMALLTAAAARNFTPGEVEMAVRSMPLRLQEMIAADRAKVLSACNVLFWAVEARNDESVRLLLGAKANPEAFLQSPDPSEDGCASDQVLPLMDQLDSDSNRHPVSAHSDMAVRIMVWVSLVCTRMGVLR